MNRQKQTYDPLNMHWPLALLLLLLYSAGPALAQQYPYKVERAAFSDRMYDEYAPLLYDGRIIYRANKRLNVYFKNSDERGNTAMNIFTVEKLGEGNWSAPRLFASELSDVKEHYGPAVLSDRGARIWFNKAQEEESGERDRIGIFSGDLVGGEWTAIEPFEYNNPRYDFLHPYVSPDGNLLFFSSNMSGGEGLLDLYVCRKSGNSWSEPENLGPAINSNRNEIYPVYYENGRLYFSSNGLEPNFGGFDLYYSHRLEEEWTAPVHLKEPFNTRRNDAWFMLAEEDYSRGYIHSNRERSRTYNIYEFSLDIPATLFESCREQEQNSYCFTFYEAGATELDTTLYRYEWVVEGKKYRQKEVDYCFDGIGNYIIQLNVIDLLSGEVLFNEATYDLLIEDIEQVYITSPDTVFVDEVVRLDGARTFLKDFTLDRHFWDMGDHTFLSDTVVYHRYYEPGTYTIRLGVVDQADQPENQQESCSYKRLVVIPRGGLASGQ